MLGRETHAPESLSGGSHQDERPQEFSLWEIQERLKQKKICRKTKPCQLAQGTASFVLSPDNLPYRCNPAAGFLDIEGIHPCCLERQKVPQGPTGLTLMASTHSPTPSLFHNMLLIIQSLTQAEHVELALIPPHPLVQSCESSVLPMTCYDTLLECMHKEENMNCSTGIHFDMQGYSIQCLSIQNQQQTVALLFLYNAPSSDDFPLPSMQLFLNQLSMQIELQNKFLCRERAIDFYEHSLASSPIGLFRLDPQGDFVYANQKLSEIFGVPLESIFNMSWLSQIHIEDRMPTLKIWNNSIAKQSSFQVEFRFLYKNSLLRYLRIVVDPIFIEGTFAGFMGTFSPISEREMVVSRNERQQFETLSESLCKIPVGIYDYDMKNNHIFWDHSICEIYGVDWNVTKTFETWYSLLHPEDVEMTMKTLDDVLNKRRDTHFSYRIVRTDGDVRHIRAKACVEFDSSGEPIRMVGINLDITDETLLQHQIQTKSEKLEAIFSSMKEGIVVQKRSGEITDINPAAIDILGLVQTIDSLDCNFTHQNWNFCHENGEFLLEHEHPIHLALETGKPQFDMVLSIRRRDGRQVWLNVNATPLFGNGDSKTADSVLCTFSDITERKKNERELAEKEAELSAVLDGMPAKIAHWDVEMKNIHANKAYAQALGYDHGHLMSGRPCQELIGEQSFSLRSKYIMGVLQGEPQKFEKETLQNNGQMKFSYCQLVPDIKKGEICGYFEIVTDVTDFKLLERDLIAAQEAEKKANSAKSSFLASMSHELRTPLNGIIGMTGLLSTTALDTEQKDYVETISCSSKTLLTIINDILDFSKIEADKMELDKSVFQLSEILYEVNRPFQYAAQKKGIEFNLPVPDLPFDVLGDAGRIKQILCNVIGNAIKFTAKGSVTISTDIVQQQGDSIELHILVKDTGIGIPKESHHLIFQSFAQAPHSVRKSISGTGLGLAISKRQVVCKSFMFRLVEMMNGSITFTSDTDQGSTFDIRLPLEKKQRLAQPLSCPPIQKIPQYDGKILVAEDNPTNQKVIGRLLEKRNCRFCIVANGKEALDQLDRDTYDLILMDCQMPEMDGYEATRIIRSATVCPSIPIVAITANAIQGDKEKCLDCGMNDYITKPIKQSQFDGILSKYLEIGTQ